MDDTFLRPTPRLDLDHPSIQALVATLRADTAAFTGQA